MQKKLHLKQITDLFLWDNPKVCVGGGGKNVCQEIIW